MQMVKALMRHKHRLLALQWQACQVGNLLAVCHVNTASSYRVVLSPTGHKFHDRRSAHPCNAFGAFIDLGLKAELGIVVLGCCLSAGVLLQLV